MADVDALKAMLLQRDGELAELRNTDSTLEQALSVRGLEIEQLKLQLAKLNAEEGASSSQAPPTEVRRKAERQPLPEHLAREERVLEPQERACSR